MDGISIRGTTAVSSIVSLYEIPWYELVFRCSTSFLSSLCRSFFWYSLFVFLLFFTFIYSYSFFRGSLKKQFNVCMLTVAMSPFSVAVWVSIYIYSRMYFLSLYPFYRRECQRSRNVYLASVCVRLLFDWGQSNYYEV